MDPIEIIKKHYDEHSEAYRVLMLHSEYVKQKAVEVANRVPELHPDIKFIEEAAMLHDIGMIFCDAENIGCTGKHNYMEHGVLGRELLEKEGLPKHALICENHVGTGLTKEDIEVNDFPIPARDMLPKTVEEEIVCFADKFVSKSPSLQGKFRTKEQAREHIARYGDKNAKKFDEWCEKFKEE